MTLNVRVQEWNKPLPAPDKLSSAFWSAAAIGRLLIQVCPACGSRQFYPRGLCVACAATPDWFEASGHGTVYTFTIIRQNGAPSFAGEVPYVVAMIDLEEGPRMMGNVIGCAVDEVYIGMPVMAVAIQVEPDLAVVQWEPYRR